MNFHVLFTGGNRVIAGGTSLGAIVGGVIGTTVAAVILLILLVVVVVVVVKKVNLKCVMANYHNQGSYIAPCYSEFCIRLHNP